MLRYDFIVIGSGMAGLSYALMVASRGTVAVVTKKRKSDSNTNYAQGGIASVISPIDSFDKHLEDTVRSGCGLTHREVAERIIRSGPDCINSLIELGVGFSRENKKDPRSDLLLGREGGHSERRVVHVADYTGREIERALLRAVHENDSITLFENHVAVDLIMAEENDRRQCIGVTCFDSKADVAEDFFGGSVLLASGGAGVVYLHTSNPPIATGDGVAMAYRAGASVSNMEFIQFHPTTLFSFQGRSFLISEAVRGEGGRLYTVNGERFMFKYHPDGELATRDTVARAIDSELKSSGDKFVHLDVTHLDGDMLKSRFPNIYRTCRRYGIDITNDRIPVVPAAHYMCGGAKTDLNCRTDITGLYACGEVAMTGMHGANRLASNSLLEAIATAQFAAEASHRIDIDKLILGARVPRQAKGQGGKISRKERVLLSHDRRELLNLMWDYVGVVRSDQRLRRAEDRIKSLVRDIEEYFINHKWSYEAIELRNLATCAKLIIDFAIERKESRGLHYNIDHPETDDINWKRELVRQEEKWI